MPLLICPDCGNHVSDQAERCPKCGCPIEYVLKQTEETSTHKTDVYNANLKKCKNLSVPIFIVVACICCVLIITFVVSKPDKKGYYKGIEWGSSTNILKNNNEIEEIAKRDNINNQEFREHIENYDNILGINGYIYYYFENEKLYQVKLFLDADYKVDGAYEKLREINKKSIEEFKKAYGQQKSSGYYHNMWETDYSILNIDMNANLVISYRDIKYSYYD